MKIDEFFQKGYYINLDKRPERKKLFENEVSRIGLSSFFERIPGVDDIETAKENKPSENETVWKGDCCSKAFHNTFLKIKEEGYDRVLVCEDDMMFCENGLENVEKALDQISEFPDWDFLYFGGLIIDGEVKRVSENLLKPNIVLTFHAVGINSKCIDELLTFRPYTDCIYDGWIGDRTYFNKYFVHPMSVIQREGESDIDITGNAITHDIWNGSYNKFRIV